MKNALFGVLLALQFLTRIPIPISVPWTPDTRRWAVRAYPLVGLMIGGLLALVALGMQNVPAPVSALAVLSVWVTLSGGLHLDGIMDIADALGSNQPMARRWEIMKDPQIGSFGMLALVFLLAWKGVLLWALLAYQAPLWWLLMLPALGRWAGVALLVLTPCAQQKGLAWSWQQSLSGQDVALALVPIVLIALLAPAIVLMMLTVTVFVLLIRWLMLRLFNGINGDMVGATIEGGELWLLILLWSWWQFATVSPLGI
ncbi:MULTISPECIES: adenosylcobinamide-GDP ribazoletransferase [Halomonadaceae]|uniref:adenosylcobinamide-GDP ribazoletransferase n=1 Tax=Halomonadaceae TaxID=28256 RepID=UPI0012F2223E|nr:MULTISPECIES: adenosylcobinamide-GDP ribazoletransferase [Halomonas]CAD5254318.1 Adenosylcobinamide-GDP ribazoletransferase [Halomonas sp. I3]CAD5254531.1 Adenosylcobinamide-GDP ribazoletransferase [Halomonas sp. 156]CAD5294656.1 Adenosylcobinamide-GDP ribazoletransferase [Halomonas sp. 113]CAD5295839.1 Adenosylcobinamide-GDP ribazoletransferase [Halomonas sp. 59]VXB84860.1 Adenosylcobinamide-GDP ribazoletransferase [Halomonas titanicae]